MNPKWDSRFMGMARLVASWSKDPSTKVGAVITRGKVVVSLGFNGLARGVGDSTERYENRDFKYPAILHAEVNALLFARQDLVGCTIYTWPMPPCATCAAMIIQSGITRVVTTQPTPEQRERWGDLISIACQMYADAGVQLEYMEG